MLKSTEHLIAQGMRDHIIRDSDLAHVFKGSAARRYALVNKALKKGEWIRLCRGYYLLAAQYQQQALSLYKIANCIVPHSFITAESALCFHGWIPERVVQVTSIAAFGRKREFQTPLGIFSYFTVPVALKHFYEGVNLFEINNQNVYIANPLRALMDYVYLHNIKNVTSDFLEHSLRINRELLDTLKKKEIRQSMALYRTRSVQQFLKNIENKDE